MTDSPKFPWLREISIDNFRAIDHVKLSFTEPNGSTAPIAVLAGPNGSGKTSVLEACLLAVGHAELLRGSTGSAAIRAGALDFNIRAIFDQGDKSLMTIEINSHSKPKPVSDDCSYFSSWRASAAFGALPATAGKKGKRPAPTEENRLWIIKQYLVNTKAFASMSPNGSSVNESAYEKLIGHVNRIWEMFYPGRSEHFSVDPAGGDDQLGYTFDVFLNQAGTRIPIDGLSSGQLEVFLLAGSALPHTGGESLLIIDEPELHLDPQWHRLIVRAMRTMRPHAQIIIGTHSPEIYDSVLSHERHFLVPADDPRAHIWKERQEGQLKA